MKSIEALDWSALTTQLDEGGFAQTPRIYTAAECKRLAASFEDDERFRSTVDMRRHRFAVIFPTRQRPVRGKRGHYRVAMRHGAATVHSGQRITLGVIFHDAT